MRRIALVLASALGAVVCLLGGTVLFSALQDTARTGTNSVESAALGSSADIQLAAATNNAGVITCGTFSEDLASGLFSATGVSPGFSSQEYFCVKNAGTQEVMLSALADELTDVDFACTGDEAANGDASCGQDQLGELSSVLTVGFIKASCQSFAGSGTGSASLKSMETTPLLIETLAGGATGCFAAGISYLSTTDNVAKQKAQSDRVTWRFRFSAQA
jgi:hypothetical protein